MKNLLIKSKRKIKSKKLQKKDKKKKSMNNNTKYCLDLKVEIKNLQ